MKLQLATRVLFAGLTIMSLSGCNYMMNAALGPYQTYPGAERPLSELSVVREMAARIEEINGTRITGLRSEILHLLPGQKDLVVYHETKTNLPGKEITNWTRFRLKFLAEAGHEYKLAGTVSSYMPRCVSISDVTAKRLIVSTHPACNG